MDTPSKKSITSTTSTSTSTSTSQTPDDELPNRLSSVDDRLADELRHRQNVWHSNYHEAAIYIEEGLNNDKFENHPRKKVNYGSVDDSSQDKPPKTTNEQDSSIIDCNGQDSGNGEKSSKRRQIHNRYPILGGQYTTIETYILVHNRYFYQLDLFASLILLFLAIFEPPAVASLQMNTTIHAAIEIFALATIAMELILKFRWMGPQRFSRHGRTVIKAIVLFAMIIEAIVIFSRQVGHARYSRALRPIFLIDNHYCNGIRRVVRQIFQSIPPILDMFLLSMFFMFVFSIFGFFLLASDNTNFSDMPATIGNLLILATTANIPDIILPSYATSRWTAIYFVLFVIIHLYLLTNLTMAAVYESFTRKEKEKFHKLLLHRRKACQEAFKLLVSRRQPDKIQYRQFMGLMKYLNRKYSMFDSYLIFKALDNDKSGSISLEEFYQIYDFLKLDWKLIYPELTWFDMYDSIPKCLKDILKMLRRIQNHRYFDIIVDLTIAAAALIQFLEATAFDFKQVLRIYPNTHKLNLSDSTDDPKPDAISTTIFISLFTIEALVRLLANGLSEYFGNNWNLFDLGVLCLSIGGLLNGYLGGTPFDWVIVLRILRLVRLFEFKKRYKDLWQTLTYILLKRFISMVCVVMILYYFFAIIGMELLSQYNLRDCCKNTSLEISFRSYENGSTVTSLYYLNDFKDIVSSYVTLFCMSGATYWLAVMNAYVIVANSQWLRVYFGFYYICSIIVMNIVIAFILESFLFRINYRSKMGDKCDDANLFTVSVALSSKEIEFLHQNLKPNRDDKSFSLIMRALIIGQRSSGEDDESQLLANQFDGTDYDVESNRNRNDIKLESKDKQTAKTNKRPKEDKQVIGMRETKKSKSLFDGRYYFIFQAEQIRNKFSFTLKMYADEVEGWLAEAERADQDAVSLMISRNQIRAEHVALSRLLRRNMANVAADNESRLISYSRNRSYSSSGGSALIAASRNAVANAGSNSKQQLSTVDNNNTTGSKWQSRPD